MRVTHVVDITFLVLVFLVGMSVKVYDGKFTCTLYGVGGEPGAWMAFLGERAMAATIVFGRLARFKGLYLAEV